MRQQSPPAFGGGRAFCGRGLLDEVRVRPGGQAGLAAQDLRVSKVRICSQELTENPEEHTGKLGAGLASELETESAGMKTLRQGCAVVSSQWQDVGLQRVSGK